MNAADARDLLSGLAESGTPPTNLASASELLPRYSVGIEHWINRMGEVFFRDACRRRAHFKLVIAPYGGGKTHFLLTIADRGRQENFAAAYIACSRGISFAEPMALYSEFVRRLLLPGESTPGLSAFLRRVAKYKQDQMVDSGAANVNEAFRAWCDSIAMREYPEPAFGRVMADALRLQEGPQWARSGEAAVRWLRGEVDTLVREELFELRLARVSKASRDEFGRNLLLSLLQFIPESGVFGTVILLDEVETIISASQKARQRVLLAMRVMIDVPRDSALPVPMFGVFSGTPEILEDLRAYHAIYQRLAVYGAAFSDGNDHASIVDLSTLGAEQDLLSQLGQKLLEIACDGLGVQFDREVQNENIRKLAEIAVIRNLEISARRLFVKAWAGLLFLQASEGERAFNEEELALRFQGAFETLRQQGEDEEP